ncbi:MAG: hypothetical protein ABFS17_04800 [Chloroflexota bacterium]
MADRIIKIGVKEIKCMDCSFSVKDYTFGSFGGYGRFLGRTSKDEIAEFFAINDPVFKEVSKLVDSILPEESRKRIGCLHTVLESACDPAPSGERYQFLGKKGCSKCGSKNVKHNRLDPPIEKIYLPFVTHSEWDNLSQEEKQQRITKQLGLIGCL